MAIPPVLIGEAVLNQDVLVDSLVADVIDGLREDLHPQFGVRAYRAYRVIRTTAGLTAGEGDYTDEAAELRPQPRVHIWDGLRFVQMTCGINEAGEIRLSEISLTYTEAQLFPKLERNQESFIAIGEAHGQGTTTRLFGHTRPPFIDREKTMGWVIFLRKIESEPWVP